MPEFAKYRVFILCEDKEHNHFVRAFFKSLGIMDDRKFVTYPLVDGARSAEAHVRRLLPDALKKIRSTRENIFLVVVTDVDKNDHGTADRFTQLNEEMRSRSATPINLEEDRVLCVFPKKNIETWFAWIDQIASLDETRDYKQQYKNPKAGEYGKKFYKKYMDHRNNKKECDDATQSIRDMCDGFDRFCHTLDTHERQRG